MILLYLLIGIGLTALLHWAVTEITHLKNTNPERYRQLIASGGALALLLLVGRIGIARLADFLWLLAGFVGLRQEMRNASGPRHPGVPGGMTRAEAARILGVAENASEEEVREAYRNLMRHYHPDQGGSEYLASQINQAKDVLLKK